jgi:hypothetical protein
MKVVIISKSSSVKTENIKNFNINDLYKKCKFRKNDNFNLRHTWNYKNNYYSLFSKDKGRANSENKYDLPPPLDNDLYFGSMIVIKHTSKKPKNNDVVDLEDKEWLKLYEHLFGGFEDLGDEDSFSEEEDIPDELKTKHGYLKDGFVVSSDAEDDDEYIPDNEEEEEEDDTSETDEEADYGGETDVELADLVDDDDDEDDFIDDDEDPASELSEEEYSY